MSGAGPAYSAPASGGRMVNELRAKGVKTISIDPRFTPDAAKADIWLPIRPGTDVALQMAWIRYILVNRRYDEEFVTRWTNLPYLVEVESRFFARGENGAPDTFYVWDEKTDSMKPMEYPFDENLAPALWGTYEVDGKVYKTGMQLLYERCEEFTLEKAAEICWLDADRIKAAIEMYLENSPSGICLGVATDQTPNSVQAAMAADTIDFLMGNLEKPGALMQRFHTSGVLKVPNYSCCTEMSAARAVEKTSGWKRT